MLSCRVIGSVVLALALPLASAVIAACGGDQVSLGDPPVEIVTPSDWSPVLALVRSGDTIYMPRLTRLDAIDVGGGGAPRRVAGFDYARCLKDNGYEARWKPMVDDPGYPRFVADGNAAFLSDSICGVWSVSLTDASKRGVLEERATDGRQSRWGGQLGPRWDGLHPPAVALDGDDHLIVCITEDRVHEQADRWHSGAPPDSSVADRVEVWTTQRNGDPKEKLATFEPRESSCTHVLQDSEWIFVATNHAIHRLARGTNTRVTIATDEGASFGWSDGRGLGGLVQDADHLYLLRRSVIERLAKDGSSRAVLVPSSGKSRVGIATDGKHVYWAEHYSLYRVPVTGGTPEMIVAGNEARGVYPMPPIITEDQIWFQMQEKVPSYSVTDPETGETLDNIERHYSIVRVAR